MRVTPSLALRGRQPKGNPLDPFFLFLPFSEVFHQLYEELSHLGDALAEGAEASYAKAKRSVCNEKTMIPAKARKIRDS